MASAPERSPVSQSGVDASVVDAVVERAPIDAPDAPAAVVAPVAAVAAPPRPVLVAADQCRGSKLEIASVVKACEVRGGRADAAALPAGVTATVQPALLVVAAGGRLPAALVLTNTAAEEVTVVLDNACGHAADVRTSIETADGKPADETGGQCGKGEGCGRSYLAVALAPNGTLRIPFTIDSRLRTYDAGCHEKRIGKVKPGTYQLHVWSRVSEQQLPITVRPR